MKTAWLFLSLLLATGALSAQNKLTVEVGRPGVAISPTPYGIFFEDINHAADGGLYAELIRNRSFEDAATDENSLAEPSKVVPVTSSLGTVNSSFSQTFKANSVTILQLKVTPNSIGGNRSERHVMTITPNPVGSSFEINESGFYAVEIFDMLGKSVLRRSLEKNESVDVSRLESGMYVVKASSSNGSTSTPLLKL